MPRLVKRLTTKTISSIKEPGLHADGDGLYLAVDPGGGKRWTFVFRWKADPNEKGTGKRREMGLGGISTVSLAEARAAADLARKLVKLGQDPIAARKFSHQPEFTLTFGKTADNYIDAMKPGLRNAKHAAQWETTLGKRPYDRDKVRIDKGAHDAHISALNELRAKPVNQIAVDDIILVLKPIWSIAPETAARVRGRIERVLDAAKVSGYRSGDNPARWNGNLALILPSRRKGSRGHHEAADIDDVPNIVARLRAVGGVSANALEFCIQTAARTGEVLGASWGEIDMQAKLWTIRASRMKAGREHRVPLTDRCITILKAMATIGESGKQDAHVFPGARPGKPLSDMALSMALRRLDLGDITVHGMRSTFRDWCGDRTEFPREIAEAALAHAVGDAVEVAYRRGDALEKRRALMIEWSAFCEDKK